MVIGELDATTFADNDMEDKRLGVSAFAKAMADKNVQKLTKAYKNCIETYKN